MDDVCGGGWRLVLDETLTPITPRANQDAVTIISLAHEQETEGVVAAWMQRHDCHAALLRPDHYVYGTAIDDAEIDALLAEQHDAIGH